MVNDVGVRSAGSCASTETTVRRHERSWESSALFVFATSRPNRTASITESDTRRALYPEPAETGSFAELARRSAKHTQQVANRNEAYSSEVAIVRSTSLSSEIIIVILSFIVYFTFERINKYISYKYDENKNN